MIKGQEVWNVHVTKGMEMRTIGNRQVCTFSDMKNNYYEILEETAEKFPDKIGFSDNWNRAYTYGTFIGMVDDFAQWLKEKGLQRGQHVGMLLHNSIEFCTVFYAICKIGAVVIPFPSKYREHEIQALIEKADIDLLVAAERFTDWVKKYEEQFPIVYSVDEEEGYGFRHLELPKGKRGGSQGKLEDEMILMFTSGTTSVSKGVVMKNYNVIHATMVYHRLCEITPEDKTIIPVPIYHVTGLIALLGLFVYSGGTVYLYRRYEAHRILECIEKNKITFMHGSPTVFGLLMDLKEEYPALPSLRMMLCGSSYMPVEKLKQLHKWLPTTEIRTVFGMTETASPGTLFPTDTALSIYPSSSGRPVPGLELKILDDDGHEVETGTVGTVYIRGANVVEYYYKMESPLFTEDGWLDTGDM